jgi:hypothetical protein
VREGNEAGARRGTNYEILYGAPAESPIRGRQYASEATAEANLRAQFRPTMHAAFSWWPADDLGKRATAASARSGPASRFERLYVDSGMVRGGADDTCVGLLILSALFRSTHVVMSECREQKVVEMGCLARVRRHFRESGGISPSDNPKYTGGQT